MIGSCKALVLTGVCGRSDGPAKMILPNERTIKENEENALRNAISRMVSAETVKSMHIPALGKHFTKFMSKYVHHYLYIQFKTSSTADLDMRQNAVLFYQCSG